MIYYINKCIYFDLDIAYLMAFYHSVRILQVLLIVVWFIQQLVFIQYIFISQIFYQMFVPASLLLLFCHVKSLHFRFKLYQSPFLPNYTRFRCGFRFENNKSTKFIYLHFFCLVKNVSPTFSNLSAASYCAAIDFSHRKIAQDQIYETALSRSKKPLRNFLINI